MRYPLLIKPASDKCNLSCTYCFYLERPDKPLQGTRKMTLETLARAIESYRASSSVVNISFQGGEPTLMGLPWFREAARIIGSRAEVQLVTNGTLLDQDWFEFLETAGWVVGLSVDSLRNLHRGVHPGVIEDVCAKLQAHEVEYTLLCVVTEENLRRPLETLRYLGSLGPHVHFIPAKAVSPGADGHGPTGAEFHAFLKVVAEEAHPGGVEVSVRNFQNMAAAWGGHPMSCEETSRCGYPVIEADGSVYPCDFFVEQRWRLGNVMDEELGDLLNGERMRSFVALKETPSETCSSCPVERACNRGCPRDRYLVEGSFSTHTPMCEAHLFAAEITKRPKR